MSDGQRTHVLGDGLKPAHAYATRALVKLRDPEDESIDYYSVEPGTLGTVEQDRSEGEELAEMVVVSWIAVPDQPWGAGSSGPIVRTDLEMLGWINVDVTDMVREAAAREARADPDYLETHDRYISELWAKLRSPLPTRVALAAGELRREGWRVRAPNYKPPEPKQERP